MAMAFEPSSASQQNQHHKEQKLSCFLLAAAASAAAIIIPRARHDSRKLDRPSSPNFLPYFSSSNSNCAFVFSTPIPIPPLSIQPPPHHPPSNTNSRSLSSQFGAGPGHLSHSLLTNSPIIPSHKHIATQHRPRGSITHCQPIITQRKLPPTQTHLQVKRFNPSSAHPTRTYVFCGLARAKCKSSPGFRRWLFRLPANRRSLSDHQMLFCLPHY